VAQDFWNNFLRSLFYGTKKHKVQHLAINCLLKWDSDPLLVKQLVTGGVVLCKEKRELFGTEYSLFCFACLLFCAFVLSGTAAMAL
jgi:hypothetical protein